MEQFRLIGEVLGSLRALMVLQDDILVHRRQCILLLDIFCLAFDTIAEEIRLNLRLEERNFKWKALDQPLRELYRVFKEGELYIKQCMDTKDWWGKTMKVHQNKDSVDFHVHNLLTHFPAVIEAIENAGEISGLDHHEMQKKRVMLNMKYDKEWNDPVLFSWKFGRQYLVPREMFNRLETAWREDRWLLIEALKEKKSSGADFGLTKNELRLVDLMLNKLNGSDVPTRGKLFPSSILTGSKDYLIRRRLVGGYKEIHWLGESFALRHFFGEIEPPLASEISSLLSLSHSNILHYLCGFYDEDKKECFLVMEMMNKDLFSYIKENSSQRRRILFSLPVVVDLMLQIARAMEYLHSQKIYHGELNHNNVLLSVRNSTDGYLHVKVSGFGLSSVNNIGLSSPRSNSPTKSSSINPFIWYSPEVLAEQEQPGSTYNTTSKYSEKADVYSFGMLCFELLTGKVPFEDSHLQSNSNISRNIRAGERPLFSVPSPKYLVNLTKKCWHSDSCQRPSFASICRVLRYIKKFLVMNQDQGLPELHSPQVDYFELEAEFLKKISDERYPHIAPVSQIPFQMFSYRLLEKDRTFPGYVRLSEKDKTSQDIKDPNWEIKSDAGPVPENASDTGPIFRDAATVCKCENMSIIDDHLVPLRETRSVCSDVRSICSEIPEKRIFNMKKLPAVNVKRSPVTPRSISAPKLSFNPGGLSLNMNRDGQLPTIISPPRRTKSRPSKPAWNSYTR